MEKQLIEWMEMERDDVIAKFGKLKHAEVHGRADVAFCYIPGTRRDRTLLVAHADTVWDGKGKRKVSYDNGMFFSKKKNMGIGADDRAGCAILWELRELGHSLLITTGEESGCLGSQWLMQNIFYEAEIEDHNFAIQFDRCSNNDAVYYQCGSKEFVEFITEQTGYDFDFGSFTDICELCEEICGVNLSTGYDNEHTIRETLDFAAWRRTLTVAQNLLRQKNLPKFPLTVPKSVVGNAKGSYPINNNEELEQYLTVGEHKHIYSEHDEYLCQYCGNSSSSEDIQYNDLRCPYCYEMVLI